MVDIAEEAGASRQSIYRFFEDRSALIRFILDRRITDMAASLRETFARYDSLEETLVEGSIASLKVSRSDVLFSKIVATSLDLSIEQFMLRGSQEINDSMASLWNPILERARLEGKLADTVSNSDIIEWVRHFHTILTMRDDLDEVGMRRMLQRFFVPSIIHATAPGAVAGGKRNNTEG